MVNWPNSAQVGREEQRHQAVAAGPAHDEREAAVAGQVQRARHADERRRAHPVRARRHAVEQRRHAPTRDVVLGDVLGGPAHDADAGVEADGGEQEDVADPVTRQAHLFEDRKRDHEDEETAGVPGVDLLQLALDAAWVWVATSVSLVDAVFLVQAVHVARVEPVDDDVNDQRALCSHVEGVTASRKS